MLEHPEEDLGLLKTYLASNRSSLIAYKNHSGKSKHLTELAKHSIKSKSRPDPEKTALLYVDCKMFPLSLKTDKFWQHIFRKLGTNKNISKEFCSKAEDYIQGKDYDAFELKLFFDDLVASRFMK